jgi:hypothetical protein
MASENNFKEYGKKCFIQFKKNIKNRVSFCILVKVVNRSCDPSSTLAGPMA